jgi:hypothetical protein
VNPGDVFWRDESGIGPHRWVVLSTQTADDRVLAAPITSFRDRPYEERTCILKPVDYPELDHDSWIRYDRAKLIAVRYLASVTRCTPMPEAAWRRSVAGAGESDRIAMGFQDLLADQGLI